MLLYLFAGFVAGAAAVGLIAYIQLRHQQEIIKIKEAEFTRRESESAAARKQELEQIKSDFQILSQKIFEEKSSKFVSISKETIGQIVNPFNEKLKEFKESVESAKLQNAKLNTQLSTELKGIMEQSKRLETDAKNLTSALRNTGKVQGDWGEMILSALLERSGLKAGQHYEIQPVMRDKFGNVIHAADGSTFRPDMIVHYPNQQDIVIDSKASLTKYVEYVNCDDADRRKTLLKEHVESVRRHVVELSKKNYSQYLILAGKDTTGYTVMFIPNEGSYQAAMSGAPDLWQEAFDQKILIASPMNLLTLLELIRLAWMRVDQDVTQQEIFKTADELIDRLYAFYTAFDKIQIKLQDAQNAFDEATRKLKDEPRVQSVVKSGLKLRKLRDKVNKQHTLPKSLAVNEEEELAQIPENAE